MMKIPSKLILLTRPFRYAVNRLTYSMASKRGGLVALKDCHKDKPMVIIGNGPSLNKTPLDDFAHVPSIGMNKIDMIFSRVKWRPSYIVCNNGLVVKQHADVFAKSEIPVFLSWKNKRSLPKTTKSVEYFLSTISREFSTDISKGVGSAATVTYTALQMAYYMGANPIIIFGVDHSFKYEGKANDISKREGEDQNHFDPNYFKSGSYWGVPNLDLSEKAYLASRIAFEADGRKIYDATIGGKLTIFDKITLNEAKALVSENKTP